MNRLFVCAVALGLLAFAPASAQQNNHDGDKRDSAASHGNRGSESHQNDRGRAATGQSDQGRAGDTHANSGEVRRNPGGGAVAKPTATRTVGAPNNGPAANVPAKRTISGSGWSGNTAGPRPEIGAMRRNMQASRHFRNGSYKPPRGYQQRHWGYGERLPHSYFVSSYWIGNFMMFDLFAPPSYLVWVRVGDDALLIDRQTGEIVQVRYGVFY